MRLPDSRRDWLEATCRGVAGLLLAILAYRALRPMPPTPENLKVESVTGLSALSREDAPSRIHFKLRNIPNPAQRAWQDALRRSGSNISWSGELQPVTIAMRAIPSPLGGYVVAAQSPNAKAVIIRDDISTIASVRPEKAITSISVPAVSGNVRAIVGVDSAFVGLPDSVTFQRILVIANAGWEAKFLLAALEEAGWKADAIISVAPAVTVAQGAVTTIDTAHYSAVIALDESAASRASAIALYVKSGGGLILGAPAARSQAFAGLRISEPPSPNRPPLITDTVTHASSPFAAIPLGPDVVSIEARGGGTAVAARRVDFGRVIQVAFTDTWRWRMQGAAGAISDHRDWWSNILSQVVYTKRVSAGARDDNASPYSDLIEIAGAPVAEIGNSMPLGQRSGEMLWLTVVCALLITEWTSRRLRGVR